MNPEILLYPFSFFEQGEMNSIGKNKKLTDFDFHFEQKYPIIFQILY